MNVFRLALEAETLGHVRQQLVGVAGGSLMGQNDATKIRHQKPMNIIMCCYSSYHHKLSQYIIIYIHVSCHITISTNQQPNPFRGLVTRRSWVT